MSIGERIKQRRKQLGMSAEELAEKIGKSASTVYRYENGDIEKIDPSIIMPIANALSFSPIALMAWDSSGVIRDTLMFSTRLKDIMKSRQLTIVELANKTEIPETLIQSWLDCMSNPTENEINCLASFFDMPVDYFTGEAPGLYFKDQLSDSLGSNSTASKKLRQIGEQLKVPGLDTLFSDKPDVCELVNIYDSLNKLGQQALMGTARGLSANPDMKKNDTSNDATT